MKTINLIITILFLPFMEVYAQELVYVKGYSIFQYDRADFRVGNNQRNRCIGRFVPYDFPLQVNEVDVMNEEEIGVYVRSFPGIGKGLSVFKLPPFDRTIKNYLTDSLKTGLVIKKNLSDPLQGDYTYYIHPNDSLHLYQIRYIEGHAVRVERNNDYLNSKLGLEQHAWGIWIINKSIPSFYVYLFYDYEFVHPSKPPIGFVKWEPTEEELSQFKKETKYF